jgi:DNA-binding transcriptional MerR regulator
MNPSVPIGLAARKTGVKVPTIRYYEETGLLPSPRRTASQRRLYSEADLRRLAFIRHAREMGFDTGAIRTLLDLQDTPRQSCEAADIIARARLAEVKQRIASLSALEVELERMIRSCKRGRVADCRVIEAVSRSRRP